MNFARKKTKYLFTFSIKSLNFWVSDIERYWIQLWFFSECFLQVVPFAALQSKLIQLNF